MPALRTFTLVAGVVVLLAGLLFLGQGSGVFPIREAASWSLRRRGPIAASTSSSLGGALVVLSRAFWRR